MRCLEIKRQMASDDIASVSELLDAATRADGRRPLSDHLYLDLVNGGLDGFAGFLASEPGHDHPVAYAQISRGNDAYAFELVIHPHHRYEMATIGPELIEAAIDVVATDGGGHVNWWVFEPTSAHTTLADDAGMQRGRILHQMRRPLPTGLDVTIDTRAFVPEADDDAWLAVNNRAFAHHGEQGGWTLTTFRQRQQESWFDPAGFRVLDMPDEHGNARMAGFCWTKVHEAAIGGGDDELGEIYVIAVDPDFHGQGLGRQLTLAGLDHLARRGIGTGMLYVDADNAPAVRLYEQLGFHVYCTNAAFVADVGAARAANGAP
ncbi:MAG TPA: mycothiol synthase [Ilumatobacteraceae bacterium]|nr:mycothiol synthase [Ilumatobacteraceae bacterium]